MLRRTLAKDMSLRVRMPHGSNISSIKMAGGEHSLMLPGIPRTVRVDVSNDATEAEICEAVQDLDFLGSLPVGAKLKFTHKGAPMGGKTLQALGFSPDAGGRGHRAPVLDAVILTGAEVSERATEDALTVETRIQWPQKRRMMEVPAPQMSCESLMASHATQEDFGEPPSTLSSHYRTQEMGATVHHMEPDDELMSESLMLQGELAENTDCMDGNTAAAHIAYFFSETSAIYPISPSSTMGECVDAWASKGLLNCFNTVLKVVEMQSEAGAAGMLHGLAAGGALSSTFTASQGLLLMIPNMHKIAGELLPVVIHVSARAIAGQALCIFGDHQDVMSCKGTGFALLASGPVQEASDMAVVAHIAALTSSVPFLHFFDGYRTSHEYARIHKHSYDDLAKIMPWGAIAAFKKRALNPNHPTAHGSAQSPDVFFQASEAANKWHFSVPARVEEAMRALEGITGRKYRLFDYFGAEDATDVIIIMGSAWPTAKDTANYLNEHDGRKVGVVVIRLYSPWHGERFLDALPKTVKRICVLDRVKIPGGAGEPLFLDVTSTIAQSTYRDIHVIGGRYGLGSKEFASEHVVAVYDNLARLATDPSQCKQRFSVGINDDVTYSSIPIGTPVPILPDTVQQCVFWGLGSDGTVGANREAAKLVSANTPNHVQCYFDYDSKKSGGRTLSHLRFGPDKFEAPYLIQDGQADYVACHAQSYTVHLDLTRYSKPGSVFLLNTTWEESQLEWSLPGKLKRDIAQKKLQFYIVDAYSVARKSGMGRRVNMILQTCFFKLSSVLPVEDAIRYLKASVRSAYGRKGEIVVKRNEEAIDNALSGLRQVQYPESWATADDTEIKGLPALKKTQPAFITKIVDAVNTATGNDLPVSAMQPDGFLPVGGCALEKRGIAPEVPIWIPDRCTQCNYCTTICPHAAIRAFWFDEEAAAKAPEHFNDKRVKAIGSAEIEKGYFKIQVAPFDCTGCTLCSIACPEDALQMMDTQARTCDPTDPTGDDLLGNNEELNRMQYNDAIWNYAIGLPNRGEMFDRSTMKGSQMSPALMEFSGACAGCGETPYVKLITQICGERSIIANATGCSSIWGASYPAIPYAANQRGQGPAWANSLFEDNAEFGLGLMAATETRLRALTKAVQDILADGSDVPASAELRGLLSRWLSLSQSKTMKDMQIAQRMQKQYDELCERLEDEKGKHDLIAFLADQRSMFTRITHWIFGGDGWAYDIGFGGLDHVIASGENVKILIMDTQMYSNTGGQCSKATPRGAVQRFAESGKSGQRKDICELAMTYGNVYVAQINLPANQVQSTKAIVEAQNYSSGPAIIVAYSPCISMGFPLEESVQHCELATESGFWPLYRYNPELIEAGHNPMQLDSKKIKTDIYAFLKTEVRFSVIARQDPARADMLQGQLKSDIEKKFERLKQLERGVVHSDEEPAEGVVLLYGTATGNAEEVAKQVATDLKARGLGVTMMALDDFEIGELREVKKLLIVSATAGQGEFTPDATGFWKAISNPELETDALSGVEYTVFGMGDSRYFLFNEAAKKIDLRLAELGATRMTPIFMGDDVHDDGYYTQFDEWMPAMTEALGAPPAPATDERPPEMYTVTRDPNAVAPATVVPVGAELHPVKKVESQTDRAGRRVSGFTVDCGDSLKYGTGDSLAVYPSNSKQVVDAALGVCGLTGDEVLTIEPTALLKGASQIPDCLTSRQLFAQVLDLQAHPKKQFYGNLARFASDEAEKVELRRLVTPEGKADASALRKQYKTYLDTLLAYPSARPDLAALTSMIPVMKPRAYSIASSPAMQPKDLEMTIGLNDWQKDGETVNGLATGFLWEQLKEGDLIPCATRASGIHVTDHSLPLLMIALGTGNAPMRGLIQERVARARAGEKVGRMVMIYGAQHEKTDYVYQEELQSYEKEGLLQVICAWSRDQKHKIYVTDKVKENPRLVYDILFQEDGYMVLCGTAKSVPDDVRKAITEMVQEFGDMSQAEAETAVYNVGLAGKYIVEAW